MIVEWFIDLAVGMNFLIADLFPESTELPDWFVNLHVMIGDLLFQASGLAVWADWGFIFGVVTVVVATWAVSFVVKIVRAGFAHVPEIGGAG